MHLILREDLPCLAPIDSQALTRKPLRVPLMFGTRT